MADAKVVIGEVDADTISKYTVLAGAYCLLRYMENTTGSIFSQNSLRSMLFSPTLVLPSRPSHTFDFRLQHGSGGRERMTIDGKTSANLEIICNLCSGSQKESLFGVINYTRSVCALFLIISTRPNVVWYVEDGRGATSSSHVAETLYRCIISRLFLSRVLTMLICLKFRVYGWTRRPPHHRDSSGHGGDSAGRGERPCGCR